MGKRLVAEIKKAFEEEEPPHDSDIVFAIEYPESYDVYERLTNMKWQDVGIEDLRYLQTNLPQLTNKAFRYFLPAFLIAALRKGSGDLEVFIVASLIPPLQLDIDDYQVFVQRMSGFTSQQRIVISRFLKQFYGENTIYVSLNPEATMTFWKSK